MGLKLDRRAEQTGALSARPEIVSDNQDHFCSASLELLHNLSWKARVQARFLSV
jgi:hypothetical protein